MKISAKHTAIMLAIHKETERLVDGVGVDRVFLNGNDVAMVAMGYLPDYYKVIESDIYFSLVVVERDGVIEAQNGTGLQEFVAHIANGIQRVNKC